MEFPILGNANNLTFQLRFCQVFAAHLLRYTWFINFSWRDLTRFGLYNTKRNGSDFAFVTFTGAGKELLFATSVGTFNIGLISFAQLLSTAASKIEKSANVKYKYKTARKIFRLIIASGAIDTRPEVHTFPVTGKLGNISKFSAVFDLALRDPDSFSLIFHEGRQTFTLSPRGENELFSLGDEPGKCFRAVPLCKETIGADAETAHLVQCTDVGLIAINFQFRTPDDWNIQMQYFNDKRSPAPDQLESTLRQKIPSQPYWFVVQQSYDGSSASDDLDAEIARELTECPPTPYGEEARYTEFYFSSSDFRCFFS